MPRAANVHPQPAWPAAMPPRAAFTPTDVPRLGPPALRAFFRVAVAWQLGLAAQWALLGHPPRATYYRWKQGDPGGLRPDTLERLSHIVAIHDLLHQLFDDPAQADAWLHRPNSAPGFESAPALDRLTPGRMADLVDLRRYLEGVVASGA